MKRTIKCRYGISIVALLLAFDITATSQSQDDKSKARDFVQTREVLLHNKPDGRRVPDLKRLASAALEAGDLEKAEKFALDLQADARKRDNRFSSDSINNAIHLSNTILGLIALEKGQLEAAKDYLFASSKVNNASGILTIAGPEMLLAKRLIEKGERDTVIRYLDDCAVFWKNDRGKLEKWKGIINNGGTPDFGANLKSQLNFWKYS